MSPYKFHRADGEVAFYEATVGPVKRDAQIIGLVVNSRDITERKQVEGLARLATVVRDSNNAITVQDFEGKILAWNPGAERMYGWSEAEMLAMNIRDIVPEEKREEALTHIKKIAEGKVVESFQTQRMTNEGQVLDVWLTVSVLVDDAGKPYAVATTERDVTGA